MCRQHGGLIVTNIFDVWSLWFCDFYVKRSVTLTQQNPLLLHSFFSFIQTGGYGGPLSQTWASLRFPSPITKRKSKDILHHFSHMETYFWQICRSSTFSLCFSPHYPVHSKFFLTLSNEAALLPTNPSQPILDVWDNLQVILWFLLLLFFSCDCILCLWCTVTVILT